MVTLNVLMFLCALTALSQAAATNDLLRSSCPAGWRKFNNRCFIYIPRTMTWARAQRNCVSLQATLASIHSFQEYHYIQRLITTATHGSPQTWIGGSDAQEVISPRIKGLNPTNTTECLVMCVCFYILVIKLDSKF
uniref:C-type lectin domain-containing protein n=1 Tax=Xiphophorus couchianus TaxID=32473 RepID=A0A3B5LDA2_9TELE